MSWVNFDFWDDANYGGALVCEEGDRALGTRYYNVQRDEPPPGRPGYTGSRQCMRAYWTGHAEPTEADKQLLIDLAYARRRT